MLPTDPARSLSRRDAAVAAHVVQRAHLLVVVAQHDHRVRADVDRDEVAGLADLGLGRDEEPGARPDRRDVEVEDLLAGVARAWQRVPGNPRVEQCYEVLGPRCLVHG